MAPYSSILSARYHVTILLFVIFLHFIESSSNYEADILLGFKASLKTNANTLSDWSNAKPPCDHDLENWQGILCQNGSIWGLKLENMGLEGDINVDLLSELKNLRTISLMNNNFGGSLPNLNKLISLKTVYLSNNQFSGEIPANAFDNMPALKKIHLAQNKFSGQIPQSLTKVSKLMELMLENNKFKGGIPDFRQDMLKLFNVSNNELSGVIPSSLSRLGANSFSGNRDLCGMPLKSCSSPVKLSVITIVVAVVLVIAAVAALVVVVIILRKQKKTRRQDEVAAATTHGSTGEVTEASASAAALDRMERGSASPEQAMSNSGNKKAEGSVKLTFLKEDHEKFDMAELLKASAEILGGGVFGSTYKAALNSGNMMVVKRFKYMNNVGREEFNEHMRRLGRLNHENMHPIVAFYYRKEEKLLVSEYVENVSLAVHLHGNKSRGHSSPNWPTRLKIIKGTAKGLQYLYNDLPSLMAPHGHLKSSNVLLDTSFRPYLTDYGLIPVINQEHAKENMVAYKSPEYKHGGRITKKTDVWSLGILILEVLTGRFPANFLHQGRCNDTDLAMWVESVLKDENSINAEVFDRDMGDKENSEGEMMKLLKIGLSCSEVDVKKRLDIKEAVNRINEIKEKDGSESAEFFPSYSGEGTMRSSGLSDISLL